MKKVILTVTSAILLTGAGVGYAANTNTEEFSYETPIVEYSTMEKSISNFEEYTKLVEMIDLDALDAKVIEDRKEKRIIHFNKNGKLAYKSIYIKRTDRLKVIDVKGGVIFEGVIEDEPTGDSSSDAAIEAFSEYKTLIAHVDVTNLKLRVTEDNHGKRIILLNDQNNKLQYKSIFVKKNHRLKIIDVNGGLVFEGALLEEEIEESQTDSTEQEVVDSDLSHEVPEQETPKVEVPQQEAPKVETPQQETTKQETNTVPQQVEPAPQPEEPKVEVPQTEAPQEVEAPKQEEVAQSSSIAGLAEYNVIASHIDLNSFSAQIVEDNRGKRIVLMKDGNGQPRYKSIYIKNNNHLKIIDMRGGLLYNGSL